MNTEYQDYNSKCFDKWNKEGWTWGIPIDHETFLRAKNGEWEVLLTPTKPMPHEWLGDLHGKKLLGLASGGGQQMPIFTALGAKCTVFDYSDSQLKSEELVAKREGYSIEIVKGDMSKPLPFKDARFDIIFSPVSHCYIEDVVSLYRECARILKKGGVLVTGVDNGLNFAFDDEETVLTNRLPFNPLKDEKLYKQSVENDWGIQFSHTIEEELGGQLKAGLTLTDIYSDVNDEGRLHDFNVPSFYATRTIK